MKKSKTLKNIALGYLLVSATTSYAANSNLTDVNKVSGFTFHPADNQETCQANHDETHFDFCSKQAINQYQKAIQSGAINFNQEFMIVRFDVKTKRKSGTYAETYLAVLNPKTRDVYQFPFVISYDRFSSISKSKFPKINYSKSSKNICSLEKNIVFYGDAEVYKMWDGKECFALEKEENGYRYPTIPISSYENQ